MDAAELARWTRFAGKGGIGKGTAVQDCVAKNPEDLMFLKDDEIVVLMQIKDQKDVFLGYCEGVVGRFDGSYVRMHGKLKTPVMTKRSSSSRASSSLSVSQRHTSTSQSPVPSLADAISLRAMVSSPNPPRSPAFSTSSIPSTADSNATIGTVHGHRLHPGASYSSSSSAQESASPETPNYYNQSFTSDESPKHPGIQREVPLRDDSMDLPSPSSSQYSDRDQRPVTPPSSTQSPRIVASPTSTGLSTPPAASAPMPSPYSPPRDGAQDLVVPLSSSVNGLSVISPARTDFSNTSSGGAFDDSTDARMSVASDGVMGIGLSLLQNFANGGDGDDASFMSRSESSTPEPEERAESPSMESQSHESTVGGHDNYSTQYTAPQELSPIPSHIEPEPEHAEPEPEPSQEIVAPSPPPEANERRNSLQPSLNPSEASSFDPEDWEGASDIYDDYRYSRMSMASKMSRFSRMSKMSVFTGGAGGSGGRERDGSVSAAGLPYPPPVPPTFERSYSADSFRSGQPNFLPKPGMESPLSEGARRHTPAVPSQDSGRPSFVSTSTTDEPETHQDQKDQDETPRVLNIETAIQANVRQSDASQYSIQSPVAPSEPSPSMDAPEVHDDSESVQFARARPAPLEFATSPLLHATFGGSPGFSPAMHTGYTGSTGSEVASPPYSATSFEDREVQGQGNLGGAASALRQKIEIERNATSPVPPSDAAGKAPQDQERRETREIVIDDDGQSQDEDEEGEDETVISPQAGPSRANSISTSSHSHHGQLNVPPANTYPSEKKRAPLIVVNPAPPPPPYSPSLVPTSPGPESTPPVTPMTPSTPISPMPEPQHQQSPLPSPQVQSFSRPPSAPSTPQDGSFPQSRQSLFMPHPNAPKPTPGPMAFGPTYGRKQLIPPHMLQQMQLQNASAPFVVPGIPGGPMGPGAGGLGSMGPPGSGPNLMNTSSQTMRVAQAHRARTVYGLTQGELGTSMGPVPIVFSLEPLNNIPALRLGLARRGTGTGDGAAPGVGGSLAQPVTADGGRRSGEDSKPNGEREEGGMKASESGNVIPRANFFPKTSGARPRSRSFSGFDSTVAESTIPQESPDGSIKIPAAQERTVRTSLPSQRPPVITAASTARQSTGNHRINAPREHRPSPLAMAQPIVSASSVPSSPATAVPPRSLTGRPSISSLHSAPSGPGNSNLRKSVSTSALVQGQTSPSSPLPSVPAQPPWAHRPRDDSIGESISSRVSSASQYSRDAPPLNIPASKPSLDSSASQSSPKSSRRRQGSIDTVASQYTNGERSSPTPGSGPVARNTSLRSKLSLGHLRSRPSLQTSRDESMTSESLHETIQVEDMDFELVKPNIHREHSRASEDSIVSHSPNTSTGPGLGARKKSSEAPTSDLAAFLRSTSPGGSNYKPGGMPPSPHSPGEPKPNPNLLSEPAHPSKTSANKTGVEAHRNRELKWVNAISSTPSSQARKSKKFKKLVYEGVPGSVRYQVWAHLADSKAKRIEGLYAQLGKRGDVAAKDLIVADAKSCFANARGRLGEPDGPVVSLLQAYLTMVPDIQYHRGLTVIAGQLLMHAPEEDAFWIFISMMDTHLRSYFAANAIQMDVDASLFVKAVEAADPSVAKKLFTDMSISPVAVCRPWFASLFAESLPTEYFERVWDIFLCEGVPYLFRVGLALITCCRRRLLDCNSEEAVLQVLHHPPPILLSSTADILVELANSVKLKDDDVRKQRTKMEAQIKRQAQQQQTRGLLANSGGGPAISLPR